MRKITSLLARHGVAGTVKGTGTVRAKSFCVVMFKSIFHRCKTIEKSETE